MKIKERWKMTATPHYDDIFMKVPWWLRIKRFAGKPRSDDEYTADIHDAYLNKTYGPDLKGK